MIEHVVDTGSSGQLRVQDNTDDDNDMSVSMWVRSSVPIAIPQLPWTYSIDNSMVGWRSFNFQPDTVWQMLTSVHVGTNAQVFTLLLGETGTTEVGGPATLSVDLYINGGLPKESLLDVKVDGVWRKAEPYVKVDGVWRLAEPHVREAGVWKKVN